MTIVYQNIIILSINQDTVQGNSKKYVKKMKILEKNLASQTSTCPLLETAPLFIILAVQGG